VLEGQGVLLWSGGFTHEEGRLRIPLTVGFEVSQQYAAGFRSLDQAVVLQVETGEATFAATLLDPERPESPYAANYQGNPEKIGHPKNSVGGWVQCVLVVPLKEKQKVFVHATLLSHGSNVLALDLAAGSIDSFANGEPHAIALANPPAG
jgi:hypothetical protein